MRKQAIARPVHANAGTEARYRRALLSAISEMVKDVTDLITEQRESNPPVLAEDASHVNPPQPPPRPLIGTSPSVAMREELNKIAARWQKRFAEMSDTVASSFLRNSFRGTDNAMRAALKSAGWSIEFKMTPAVRDAFEASLAENVGLIRSIPEKYLQQVEGIVMRNYAAGRDLQTMTREIKALSPKTQDRAALIARDQSNKANAVVTRARQKELGIAEAVWMHSHAGKEPRPTHVAMNGKRYDVSKGMYDSAVKKWIFPGELVSCRCTSRSVLPWTPAEKN
jgi:SPP1 gp7 family putative phage head morphogenesis protein